MPQLDFSKYPSQVIWLFLTFITLYYVVRSIALPKITQIIAKRNQKIAQDISCAEILRHKIELIDSECKLMMVESQRKVHDMINSTEELVRNNEFLENQRLDVTLRHSFTEAKSRLDLLKSDYRQIRDLKLQSTRLFVANILEEHIDDETLISMIENVENSHKLQKN